MEKISQGKVELIHQLKKEGKSRNEIASVLNLSWATVSKYWGKEETEEGKEGEEILDTSIIDTETSSAIFILFDSGKGPADAIKEGYKVQAVDQLWKLYLGYQGLNVNVIKDLQRIVHNILGTLENFLINFRWIHENWRNNKDIFWCPKCKKFTHLVEDEHKQWVCAKCSKKLFQ